MSAGDHLTLSRDAAMSRNWIGVASAEHVRQGVRIGIMQLSHGKASPLRRLRPGDRIAYYSPTATFRGKDKLQAFTALGIVRAGEPYQFDRGGGFCPYRRDVDWLEAHDAPIAPLLDALGFTVGKRNWGYQFRFGLFAVRERDMAFIARAMGVTDIASRATAA
jgi:EVE domain